jgi:putative nucleotidyltransferase with HDIG domain
LRDRETEGHTRRVTEMTARLARAVGFGEESLMHLRRGALLHDIGKMGIPDGILLKPGPLTAQERRRMQSHGEIGHRILTAPAALSAVFKAAEACGGPAPAAFARPPNPLLALAAEIALCHHERWDGSGYPRRLRGAEIPISARIVAVADAFDAITGVRPYKPARSSEEAGRLIREAAGTHFDPELVIAFASVERAFDEVASALADTPSKPEV